MRYIVFVFLSACSVAPVAAVTVDAGHEEPAQDAAPPPTIANPVRPVTEDAAAVPPEADAGPPPTDAARGQGACVLVDAAVVACPTPVGHIITWQYDMGGTGVCGYGGWSNDAACPTGHACTVFAGAGMAAGTCAP